MLWFLSRVIKQKWLVLISWKAPAPSSRCTNYHVLQGGKKRGCNIQTCEHSPCALLTVASPSRTPQVMVRCSAQLVLMALCIPNR